MKKASTVLLPLVLLGLCAAAIQSCASGETDPSAAGLNGSGGDSGDGSGGDNGDGSGGSGTSSGGKAGTASGGSVGTGSGGSKSGGSTGTASGGSKSGGSTGTASGGMTVIVGASSGGTTGSSTICTKMDSTMTVNNGMATNGTWSGYAYTYIGSKPATISPDCSTSSAACFMTAAKQLCVSGTVGPDTTFGASAGFGWDIGAMATSGTAGKGGTTSGKTAIAPGGTGLAYNVPGINTTMRLQVEDAAGNDYCASVPTANSGTIPWAMFTEKCYNSPPGTAYSSSTKIASVQIVVPTTSGTMENDFCFCVVSLGPAS